MADTQQGVRHQSARDAAGTVDTYDGDLRALFEAVATVPAGSTFNEAFMLWLQSVTGSSSDNINDLHALYASQQDDTYNWSSGGPLGGNLPPTTFAWDIGNAAPIPATSAFSRLSEAQTKTTTDGIHFWWQTAEDDELRLYKSRRVQNLQTNGDGSDFSGLLTGVTRDGIELTFPGVSNAEIADTNPPSVAPFEANTTAGILITIRRVSGTGNLTLAMLGSINPDIELNLTSELQTFFLPAQREATAGTLSMRLRNQAAGGPFAMVVEIPQLQMTYLRDVNSPPEHYVNPFVVSNAVVPGVQYFSTANGNTVDANGLVTFAPGIALSSIQPNPGLSNQSVPDDLAIINGVPNVSFASTVSSPTSIFVRTTGADSNGGLSEGDAVRTVDKAMEIAAGSGSSGDGFKIDIGPGRYFQGDVYPSAPIAGRISDFRDIEFVGSSTRPYLMNATDPAGVSWTDESDGTYSATVTNVNHPVDFATLDSDGMPTKLTEVADLPALLAASEGYFVSGSTIRVKPIRLGVPDTDMILFLSNLSVISSFRNINLYLNKIAWFGFKLAVNPSAVATDDYFVVCDDVLFGYTPSTADDMVDITTGSQTAKKRLYLRDCIAAYMETDGFNYNNDVFGVEYRCTVYETDGQTSTGHTGSAQLRVAGTYRDAIGAAVVADVGSASTTWMYNCTVLNSDTADLQQEGYTWLEEVDFTGTTSPATFGTVGTPTYFERNLTGAVGALPPIYLPFNGAENIGYISEITAIKRLLHSNDLTNAAWVAQGGATATDEGYTDSGKRTTLLTALGALGVADISQSVGGFSASETISPLMLIRRRSLIGTLQVTNPSGAGQWDIDLNLLGPNWVLLAPNVAHPSLTEVVAWTADVGGNGGIAFSNASDDPEVEITFVNLEREPEASTPMEVAAIAVTRERDILTDPTAMATAPYGFSVEVTWRRPVSLANQDAVISLSNGDRLRPNSVDDIRLNWNGSGVSIIVNEPNGLGGRKQKIAANLEENNAIMAVENLATGFDAATSAIVTGTMGLGLNASNTLNQFRGIIHDAKVYGGALTQDQCEKLVGNI